MQEGWRDGSTTPRDDDGGRNLVFLMRERRLSRSVGDLCRYTARCLPYGRVAGCAAACEASLTCVADLPTLGCCHAAAIVRTEF